MDNFPINLMHVYFTKTIVYALPEHKHEAASVIKNLPVNNLKVEELDKEARTFIATFTTRINVEDDIVDPYHIDMECIGIFNVKNDADLESAKNGLVLVAHNVLYGAIRESILWITGRQPFGPLNLGLSILTPNSESK